MSRSAWAALAFGGVTGGATCAAAVASRLWARSSANAVRQLLSAKSRTLAPVFGLETLEGLPSPVARYFEFALSPGQPIIRSALIQQTGEFRMGDLGAPWKPISAVQHVSTDPIGFVWDAAIRMAPFLAVRVRDTYIDGAGSMQARLDSLIPVMDQTSRRN